MGVKRGSSCGQWYPEVRPRPDAAATMLHVELHWLDVPERVKYKLSMITRRCLNGTAPQYLAAHCVSVSATESRQHLRSAASHQLVVPSYRLSSYGRRAFSVVGPTMWNSLAKQLRDPLILFTPPPSLVVY